MQPIRFDFKNLVKKLLGLPLYLPNIKVQSIPLVGIFDLLKVETIDFVQMDIQGHEQVVLEKYFSDISSQPNKNIAAFLVGTHSLDIHNACRQLLVDNSYDIIVDEFETKNQPDGILFGSINL